MNHYQMRETVETVPKSHCLVRTQLKLGVNETEYARNEFAETLLAKGEPTSFAFYKYGPPDGGRKEPSRPSPTFNHILKLEN
jgi:hypothetical protein